MGVQLQLQRPLWSGLHWDSDRKCIVSTFATEESKVQVLMRWTAVPSTASIMIYARTSTMLVVGRGMFQFSP
jgi:hypothetical protein